MFLAFFTWLLIILSRNLAHAQTGGKNSMKDACELLDPGAEQYRRLSPSSKYFAFVTNVAPKEGYSASEASEICHAIPSLEVAEVTHEYDLASLERVLTAPIWLGLNHRTTNGIFVQGNGRRIKFQSFLGMEPNNRADTERCVVLKPVEPEGDGFLAMEDVGCNSRYVGILCQYKQGTPCYRMSAEETAVPDESSAPLVQLLGGSESGSNKPFYVSEIQANWGMAGEICLRRGMVLLKFIDEDRSQHLVDFLKKHMIENHWHPATQFWTAGRIEVNKSSAVSWVIDDEIALRPTTLVSHEWAPATPEETEPFDQSGNGFESCLDISFENAALLSKGSYKPFWRASNCMLPKFFFCERHVLAIPPELINNTASANNDTSEPVVPTTDDKVTNVNCTPATVEPITFEINLTTPNTQEDIVRFLLFNVEHDLKSGLVPFKLKEEIQWKSTVLDLLVQLAKKVVSNDYVNYGLLNIAKIINLMYQNAVATPNDLSNKQIWKDTYIPHLQKCVNTTKKLPLIGRGFEIVAYKNSIGEDVPITIYRELADNVPFLDSSLDILWFLFSLSMSTCYTYPVDKVTFASNFHITFVVDFIEKLKQKWTINSLVESRGPIDLSLAFGDVDLSQSMRNLRHVVSAAYSKLGLQDIELVRPLDILTPSRTDFARENIRTNLILSYE